MPVVYDLQSALSSLPTLTLRRVWSVEVSFEAGGGKLTFRWWLFGSSFVISLRSSPLFHYTAL